MRISIFVAAVLVSVTASSYAEPPRYTRKPTLKLDGPPSERTKPTRRAPATQARPAVSADEALQLHLDRAPLRREQEALLERLVRDTPEDDPEKPDLLFRLAEHYAHHERVWRLRAVHEAMRGTARSRR